MTDVLDSVSIPLQKRKLFSHDIIDILKKSILENDLKPGDRIVETRWAKKLGVSQAPVREAIRELTVMGLVENRPYQGAFVKEINKQDIIDSYNVRMALEIQAMKHAAEKITNKQMADLKKLLTAMKRSVKNNDFDSFIENDSLFHSKILEIDNNKLLISLWEQCRIREYTRFSSIISKESLQELADRHDLLYNALEKKDITLITEEIERHFQLLIEELID